MAQNRFSSLFSFTHDQYYSLEQPSLEQHGSLYSFTYIPFTGRGSRKRRQWSDVQRYLPWCCSNSMWVLLINIPIYIYIYIYIFQSRTIGLLSVCLIVCMSLYTCWLSVLFKTKLCVFALSNIMKGLNGLWGHAVKLVRYIKYWTSRGTHRATCIRRTSRVKKQASK